MELVFLIICKSRIEVVKGAQTTFNCLEICWIAKGNV